MHKRTSNAETPWTTMRIYTFLYNFCRFAMLLIVVVALTSCQPAATSSVGHFAPSLIPLPAHIDSTPGFFTLREGAVLNVRSTNAEAMDKFGIAPDHRFTMWDWVGGRYSVWSAIGLIAEIVIGSERFEEFLRGASDIDRHFTTTPFEKNLPVLLGLIGVWNRTFLNLPTLAVLPYDQRLARPPAYLQQLEMESNGKSVSLDGLHVNFATAPIVWGEPGSNAQHSFFQMLHQGTLTEALDFIAPLRGSWGGTEGQDLALKNCFAQSQAFAYGYPLPEVEADMRKAGVSAAEIARIGPH